MSRHTSIVVLPRSQAERWHPREGELALSICNPRQSPAALSAELASVLRLGFHDTDRVGGGFVPMDEGQARSILAEAARFASSPILVHCEAGASRSVAVGLFLAAWLKRDLEVAATDVLVPNPWVLNQLRAQALYQAFAQLDTRLAYCSVFGSQSRLAACCLSVRLGKLSVEEKFNVQA